MWLRLTKSIVPRIPHSLIPFWKLNSLAQMSRLLKLTLSRPMSVQCTTDCAIRLATCYSEKFRACRSFWTHRQIRHSVFYSWLRPSAGIAPATRPFSKTQTKGNYPSLECIIHGIPNNLIRLAIVPLLRLIPELQRIVHLKLHFAMQCWS